MKRTRDQDIATSVISLGILANRLEWLLSAGQGESLPVQINMNICKQWEDILEETIDFIQTPDTGNVGKREMKSRFLSRAHYLEQIYTATPEHNRKTLKELGIYLRAIHNSISELSTNKPIKPENRRDLSAFAESVANEAIKEASKFHQEPHIHKTLESPAEKK